MVTLTVTAHGKTAGVVAVQVTPTGSAGFSTEDQTRQDVHYNAASALRSDVVVGTTTDALILSITADNMAEGDETITFTLDGNRITTLSATPASWTIGTPNRVTFTIRANDSDNRHVPPAVVTPGPGPGTGPAADNPAARAERLDAPAGAVARGVGLLAAEAVTKRLHTATTTNQLNLGRANTAAELLRQSGFNLTGGAGGRGFSVWGGGGYVSADGDHDGIDYDGDTSAFSLGIDTSWRDGLVGVAVSRSDGDIDITVTADGMKSTLETEITSVHPYLTRKFNRSQLWLTAGHGNGDAELKEPGDVVIKTDVTVTTAAFGITHARGDLFTGGISALYSRAKLDEATAAGKTLNATTADSLRITAESEAGWTHGPWRPFLNFAIRHDSGDGDTGDAADLGGGVEFRTPTVYIRLAGSGHIQGQAADEQRASLTIRKSTGDFDLGLNLSADDSGLDTARLLTGEWRF